jgi:hypothetical protein
VTPAPARPASGARTAVLVGLAASFVAVVDLARRVRPVLLLDPDPSWAVARVLLGLAVLTGVAAAGGLAAGGFRLWSRTDIARADLAPLPLSRGTLVGLATAALLSGIALRGAWIGRLPIPFLEDEVNLVGPSLALSGSARDFSDSIRPIPVGRPDPHEVVGVLYMRLLRLSLRAAGTTIFGLRLPSLAGGALSLATAGLLARALLPAGGGALAVLVLAGLRWHAILSLSGWQSILLVPLADVSALLLIASRRRSRALPAAAGGVVMGIGPHFYLSAWVAAAALAVFAAWPRTTPERSAARLTRVLLFVAGFLLAAAPLFLLARGRSVHYFGRSARHNVLREVGYRHSWMPVLEAAADALTAPWLIPDPEGRHDLPGKSRLGFIVGIPVALALARALRSPRGDLSGLLLAHAGVALAAAVAGGTAGHPNGFRFGYLTSVTAVAAAAGTLALVEAVAPGRRRAAAIASIGLLSAAGLVGLKQALLDWPGRQATFDSFHGEDTLIGRAAARWDAFGRVEVARGLGRNDTTIDTVRRYRLDPDPPSTPAAPVPASSLRSFRVASPRTEACDTERAVERVRDPWGREWAVVLARRDRDALSIPSPPGGGRGGVRGGELRLSRYREATPAPLERARISSATSNWDLMTDVIPDASQMPMLRSGGR